jgi:hypothetical protein
MILVTWLKKTLTCILTVLTAGNKAFMFCSERPCINNDLYFNYEYTILKYLNWLSDNNSA